MKKKTSNESGFLGIGIIDRYIKDVSGNWWIVFFTGILAILLGLCFILYPQEALIIFSYFFGMMIIAIGIFYIKNSFKIKSISGKYEKIKEKIKSKIS
jgi:uncharacterized membrane protein HdeD (DUF308 family)